MPINSNDTYKYLWSVVESNWFKQLHFDERGPAHSTLEGAKETLRGWLFVTQIKDFRNPVTNLNELLAEEALKCLGGLAEYAPLNNPTTQKATWAMNLVVNLCRALTPEDASALYNEFLAKTQNNKP